LIKPKRLKKGDTIGVVSPASGPWRRSDMWRSIEALEGLGYCVKTSSHAYMNNYYVSGTDAQRAEDFNCFFKDDTVDAIFCSHGGYGAARIINQLDYAAIAANPKIFVGYSDITALHLAISKFCGLVTFHGSNSVSFGSDFMTPYRHEMLFKAVASEDPIGEIKMASDREYLVKMNPGTVKGELTGGNLTMICSSLGTNYEIDVKDKILFLEDVSIEPWFIDHLLIHLLNAGKLHEAAGIVVGQFLDCGPSKFSPLFYSQKSPEDVLFDILEPLGKPLIYGLPIGHTKDMATLPMGVMAELDSKAGKLTVLERGTA